MTITTELRKLHKTMTGKDATGQTIDEILEELNDNYTGGGSVTVDSAMSDSSTNAVQNKVIKEYVDANAYAPLIVNMAVDETTGNLVGDKTFGEIKAAMDNNKIVLFKSLISGETDTTATNIICDCTETGDSITLGMLSAGAQSILTFQGTQNEYPIIILGG